MVRISLQRVILFIGFIVLAAMFFLVLTLSALSVSTTVSSPLPEGPYLVKDIMPDAADSFPSPIIPAGDKVYFFAYDDQGRNLWISDGTEAGTHQVKDLNELTGAVANPQKPTPYPTPEHGYDYPEAVGDQLFFVNDDGAHGKELWVSDGSMTGTMMIKDIYSGTSSFSPSFLTNANDQLFFHGYDDIHGVALWMSDGTVTNTNMVKALQHIIGYYGMAEMNGQVYFAGNDGVHGYELWSSDGTDEGTRMVKDIKADSASSHPQQIYATNTHVFFLANDSVANGRLLQSDGTVTGTIPVQDPITGEVFSRYPRFVATIDNELFFIGYLGDNAGLWVSNGTISGTHFIKDIFPHYYSGQAIGNRIFFFAADDAYGHEIWVSDGTSDGTYMVKDINPYTSSSYCPSYNMEPSESETELNGYFFFIANDGVHGCELWMSDGTEEGTSMVQDINSGSASSYPEFFAVTDGTLFFMADDGIHGYELWSLGNMAPVAKDDTAVSTMNNPINIPVVENDFDVNLDAFTISAVTQPSSGVVTIDGDSVVYTPDDAFIGNDMFTYTVQEDGGGLTAVGQVHITVIGERTYLPTILNHRGSSND